jgi:hypothetical protein
MRTTKSDFTELLLFFGHIVGIYSPFRNWRIRWISVVGFQFLGDDIYWVMTSIGAGQGMAGQDWCLGEETLRGLGMFKLRCLLLLYGLDFSR